MNKEERKELYEEAVNSGWNKNVAKYHSQRAYFFSKLKPLIWLMNKAYGKWGIPIEKEEDHIKLVKKNLAGKLKVMTSYPILVGSAVASFLTGHIEYMAGAGFGVYLNWRGEIEMIASKKRMDELGVDWDKTVDKWFEKYNGK